VSIHSTSTPESARQHDSEVRGAVRDLLQAVEALKRDHPEGPDLRRLLVDVQRVAEDVDLLLGPSSEPAGGVQDVIPDEDYPPGFFADAEDEGVGRHR
jgi:hypothetical protein